MTDSYRAQTRVIAIRQHRGWNTHQYKRFLAAVVDEGKELIYGDKYWKQQEKPEAVLWRNLPDMVVRQILAELRKNLANDDIERRMPLDDMILRWKLLPWLRDHPRRTSAQKAPESGPPRARHQRPNANLQAPGASHKQPTAVSQPKASGVESRDGDSTTPRLDDHAQPTMASPLPTDSGRGPSHRYFDPVLDAINSLGRNDPAAANASWHGERTT
ncbi:uncharacterized protein BKCO1_37000206 [Diplodia corticola]|uniref:Uncharacterized protein n=1 Tax=Diplodia corticola TaxID=236234 RepID=A0A1J9RXP1_9PEZI|nr:uncharacterized protein BKCO1_37000206 [Diplodia corticola]OJD32596.1 hypothetical protein BKCO1_37000206 [Diplodia corticola]